MLTFVVGPSGSGKTRWLIEQANRDKKMGNGNIVFIDSDDSHIFSLDHGVRLINASDFGIENADQLYGFFAGIISRDFDIEKIYVDGIYELLDMNTLISDFSERFTSLCESNNVELLIGYNGEAGSIPPCGEVKIVELSTEE
uniref:ATP-binding protein n=1 Tax=Ndongobacter massiliensis TaxID=1871025 RepID=UPI0009302098|nr:ATP-binding protein [Ndongobacter massiliensis]